MTFWQFAAGAIGFVGACLALACAVVLCLGAFIAGRLNRNDRRDECEIDQIVGDHPHIPTQARYPHGSAHWTAPR